METTPQPKHGKTFNGILIELKGQLQQLEANLDVYLSNQAAIGEHPMMNEEVKKLVSMCAEKEHEIEFLTKYLERNNVKA